MEKQVKIIVSGGVVQSVETNFDCKIQIIDYDNDEPVNEPTYPELIHDINKDIFE